MKMKIKEKVAYIKGLAEGLGVCAEEKTGKVISEMLSVLSDMAEKLEAVENDNAELRQYVEELDEDLGSVETDLYETDDDDDCDCDDCDCDDCDCNDCDCDCDDCDCDDCDCDEDDVCVVCPHCGANLVVEPDDDPEKLECPECKKVFSIDDSDDKKD